MFTWASHLIPYELPVKSGNAVVPRILQERSEQNWARKLTAVT